MDVRNCRRCGSIFNYVMGVPICQACREAEEKKFQIVKKFVQENVQAEIPEIIEKCEVTHNQITNWVRQERLVFAENSPVGIDCEGCGAMIKTGCLCERCKYNFAHKLGGGASAGSAQQIPSQKERKDNPKMRYLER